ncbi:hypothetical protein J1605_020540 [Eschrichtius robustus]|uniref:Ceramide kinase n=1 Tax=Eschrichtius robustus TaxID=9764 RepID=A0AB34HKZ1_ESCRO|nr:hypothetical protein J1605_020540 [Eschrichtius robustus]
MRSSGGQRPLRGIATPFPAGFARKRRVAKRANPVSVVLSRRPCLWEALANVRRAGRGGAGTSGWSPGALLKPDGHSQPGDHEEDSDREGDSRGRPEQLGKRGVSKGRAFCVQRLAQIRWGGQAVARGGQLCSGPRRLPIITVEETDINGKHYTSGKWQKMEKPYAFTVHRVRRARRHRWRWAQVTFWCPEEQLCHLWLQTLRELLEKLTSRPKHLLVFINPFGGKGQGKRIYERKVAPLFTLASITTEIIGGTGPECDSASVLRLCLLACQLLESRPPLPCAQLPPAPGAGLARGRCSANEQTRLGKGGPALLDLSAPGRVAAAGIRSLSLQGLDADTEGLKRSATGAGSELRRVGTVLANGARAPLRPGVVCVGGDGMFSEVLHGLVGRTQRDAGVDQDQPRAALVPSPLRIGIIPAGAGGTVLALEGMAVWQWGGMGEAQSTVQEKGSVGSRRCPGRSDRYAGPGAGRRGGRPRGVENRDVDDDPVRTRTDRGRTRSITARPSGSRRELGSTDCVCYSTVGTNDAETSALHIVVGDSLAMDVSSVHHNSTLLRYSVSLLGYGFYGDIIKDSERKRWMGLVRYDFSGLKTFLSHHCYEGTVSFLPAQHTVGSPRDRKPCRAGCFVCRQSKQQLEAEQRRSLYGLESTEEVEEWKVVCGQFLAINATNMSCACPRSPQGLSPAAHLGDGSSDLILIRKCSRFNFLRFLVRHTNQGDQFDFTFVEVYRVKKFQFVPKPAEDEDGSVRGRGKKRLGQLCSDRPPCCCAVSSSAWNCDGEVLSSPAIEVRVHCQLVRLFARGIEENLKQESQR